MTGGDVIDLTQEGDDGATQGGGTGVGAAPSRNAGSAHSGGGGRGRQARPGPAAMAAAAAAAARTGLPLDASYLQYPFLWVPPAPATAAAAAAWGAQPPPAAAAAQMAAAAAAAAAQVAAAAAAAPAPARARKRGRAQQPKQEPRASPPIQPDQPSSPSQQQPSKPKRARKNKEKKDKEKKEKEKRMSATGAAVSFRPKASQAVLQRIERAMPGSGHRLFLIDRKPLRPVGSEGGGAEEFHVLGATGNVYTVQISRQPRCSCPDFAKGNVCKHQLFVMLRVLGLPPTEPLVWQAALLSHEVDEVLSGHKSVQRSVGGGDVMASAAVRQQFRRLSGAGAGAAEEEGNEAEEGSIQREVEGDCPICFDELKTEGDAVSFCASCGNNVHRSCMQRWVASKHASGAQVTCPLCRATWQDGSAPPPTAAAAGGGQYVNLSTYSAAHRGVDTSFEALYGDRALWIHASQGRVGRREAANAWRELGH